MPKTQFEVKDGEIDEVSLVGKGANGEEFAMFKSKDNKKEDESEEEKDMSKTEQNEQDEEDTDESDIEKGGSNEPVDFEEIVESIEEKELDEEQKDALMEKAGIELEESEEESEEGESEEGIEKSELPEAVREKLEKAEEYEERVAKLEEERKLEKMEKQVEENFVFLPGDTSENAEMLKSVKDNVSDDVFESFESKLNALAEQIDFEKLFEEAGVQNGADAGDAFEKATQLAKERVEEGEYDSIAVARKEVWDENPELLKQYKEQRKQNV